jgi:hypothetical protein
MSFMAPSFQLRGMKKPRPHKARVRVEHPTLLACLFNVARKPVGSNHHEGQLIAQAGRWVKPRLRQLKIFD